MRKIPLLVALLLLGAANAHAEQSTQPAAAQENPSSAAAAAGEKPKSDLDFDLFDEGKKPAAPTALDLQRTLELESKGRLRRQMLTAHQVFGIATLIALAATMVIGQLNYLDLYTSGDFTGRYQNAHLGLGIATVGLFGATGALGLFAPNPYPKPIKFDTAFVHKISMILATAGMVSQVVLGPVISARAGKLDQPNIALAHLITGYATFAFMATGTIAYLF